MLKLRKIINISLLLTTLILFQDRGYSQVSAEQLEELINEGNFEQAINVGLQLLDIQPDNPSYNFKTGYAFLNTPLHKDQAIRYLIKANELYSRNNPQSTNAIEARYYLGKAYHKNYEFDKAIALFDEMKGFVKNKEMLIALEDEIKQSKTGVELKKQPVKMQITNLGPVINSEYEDHSPVLAADEAILIFTSRRRLRDFAKEKPDGQFNEDIFFANLSEEGWLEPAGISDYINTLGHEASIAISADGQQLLIYSEAENGTILISDLKGDEWLKPRNAGANINSKYRETHASISADGNLVYFTSDRPGGYGGLDIYVSARQADGTFGKAYNLGPAINTPKDEEGPFIHADGVSLYFSSKGHETMGGYDFFLSKKSESGVWRKPENLGYPINTTEDDVFFSMTVDGKRAYFASYREGGYGGLDIYMMGLPEAEDKKVTLVKGVVSACKTDISDVEIKVYEAGQNEAIGIFKPNSKTGKYLFILSRGKSYEAVFEIRNREFLRETFRIEEDADFQTIYKHIELRGIEPCQEYVGLPDKDEDVVNQDIPVEQEVEDNYVWVENLMFKVNAAENLFFAENLDKLAGYLSANQSTRIEIVGYSDTQGPESYNTTLSKRRAQVVYNYLLKKGVNKEQLTFRGDGEKKQITINNYSDGSYVWQSLPYNRRVEFNIISDPSEKLKIKKLKVPQIYDINKESFTLEEFKKYEQIFTIQLGAFSKPISQGYFQNLKDIQMYYNGKLYHYTIGEFESEDKAGEKLTKIVQLGYKDAFIRSLAYYFPRKI